MESYWLAGDIGGTNSTLALLEIKENKFKIIFEKKYLSNNYENIIEIINDFITKSVNEHKILIQNAVFAIAGKIEVSKIITPNINFVINKQEIKRKSSLKKIEFINDFTAITYSVEKLKNSQIKILNKGKKTKNKPLLVIGAGTGLGKSIYIPEKDIILESEGGHQNFFPENKFEYELCDFIKKKYRRKNIEIEDIVSGKGIENIYEFLSQKFIKAEDISKLKTKDKIAKKTFELFYLFYARTCKNFALDILCSQIYIGGGIISKNLIFSKKEFMTEFTKNIKYKEYLSNIQINIITDYNSSIIGIGNYIIKNY